MIEGDRGGMPLLLPDESVKIFGVTTPLVQAVFLRTSLRNEQQTVQHVSDHT